MSENKRKVVRLLLWLNVVAGIVGSIVSAVMIVALLAPMSPNSRASMVLGTAALAAFFLVRAWYKAKGDENAGEG